MNKRAVLRLDGRLEEGFRVTLEVGEEGSLHFAEEDGQLLPAPELIQALQEWQQSYPFLEGTRIKLENITVRPGTATQVENCRQQAKKLQRQLKAWLGAGSFHVIDTQLREAVSREDLIRVVLRCQDRRLHLLPWHSWDFIDRYQAEVAFSLPARKSAPVGRALPSKKKVRILAILGNSDGINTTVDRALLERLPDAEVMFLVEPPRQQLNEQLWEQPWDILFFAGHSQTEDCAGRIFINASDSLTLDDLRFALRRAIAGGLQLAIFNSCDGLGLVYELEQLGIPQLVVMRQPVPDRVAQAFLQHLLTGLVAGQPFSLAVKEAREKLQSLEDIYPCASWLPVIFQSPNQPTLTWQDLRNRRVSQPLPAAPTLAPSHRSYPAWLVRRYPLYRVVGISLAMTALILGGRSLGWLQSLELHAYDQFMQHQAYTAPDPNLLIIGIDEADVNKFDKPLNDHTVHQLLTKLEKYQPKVIGLDIFRDQPQPGRGWKELTEKLQTSDRIITICSDASDRHLTIAPPPHIPPVRVGFADTMLHDADDKTRRYLMAHEEEGESSCATPYSFALQVIRRFLPSYTKYQFQPGTGMSIGSRRLNTIQSNSGGYHLAEEDLYGYQFLIDFRPYQIAQTASLTDILNAQDADLETWVRDRIVLIGYVGVTSKDLHVTPRGSQAGVVIHAYMVSQILQTVAGSPSLIGAWAEPIEGLWILGWSAIAGWIVWAIHSSRLKFLLLGTALLILAGSSFLLFFKSIWVPVVPSSLAFILTSSLAIVLTTQFHSNS